MLNPDFHHTHLPLPAFATGTEAGTGLAQNSDTVRYLSDLWKNLCELQELLAKDPLE